MRRTTVLCFIFFFSSRRRHTRLQGDWSSDVCSSDLVDAYVPPRSRILDLGCGPGTDAARFAAQGHRVTAIDWSPAMVEEARRRIRVEIGRASCRERV